MYIRPNPSAPIRSPKYHPPLRTLYFPPARAVSHPAVAQEIPENLEPILFGNTQYTIDTPQLYFTPDNSSANANPWNYAPASLEQFFWQPAVAPSRELAENYLGLQLYGTQVTNSLTCIEHVIPVDNLTRAEPEDMMALTRDVSTQLSIYQDGTLDTQAPVSFKEEQSFGDG
ncbi:hypothetical protein BD414DRAFT_575821, partial [Trametes punicea]